MSFTTADLDEIERLSRESKEPTHAGFRSLIALRNLLPNRIDDMATELRRSWEAEAAMGKVLRHIEWLDLPDSDVYESCPACGSDKDSGHRSGCELADAIAHTGNPLTQEVEQLRLELRTIEALLP